MKIENLKDFLPDWVKRMVKFPQKRGGYTNVDIHQLPSYQEIKNLMLKFQVKNLVNVDSKSFKKKIDEFLNLNDYKMEDFKDSKIQRDLSTKFHWAHDHDFGEFKLKGRLGKGYIRKITIFKDIFKSIPDSLEGKKILDVGCWTGGTSLLLSAMGAEVVAIEEVKKYTESLNYLKYAFDITNLKPRNLSLYDCTIPEFQDTFDIIFFAGVLYHISDLIIGLRILFNCLKDGGTILLESGCINSKKPIIEYDGPSVIPTKGKWNWFIPSPLAIYHMMVDVGFIDIKFCRFNRRCYAIGKRKTHVDIMRSGLSTVIR
jgi:SAM-dependent methyltransferase